MRIDIVRFIKKVCIKEGLEAVYFPENDVYSIRKNGRGVHNFNSKNFYMLPQRFRESHVHALLKVGLNHNLGEALKNQLYLNRGQGKRII
jgi:hypothetical protein